MKRTAVVALFSVLAVLAACAPATQAGEVTYRSDKGPLYDLALATVASTPVQASLLATATFEVITDNKDAGVLSARFDFVQSGSRLSQTATFRFTPSGSGTLVSFRTTTTGSTTSTADRLVDEVLRELDAAFERL